MTDWRKNEFEKHLKEHQEQYDKDPPSDLELKIIQMVQGLIPHEDIRKELKAEQELHQQSAQDTEQVLTEIEEARNLG